MANKETQRFAYPLAPYSCESGAVLVLVAMLAVAFVILVSLVIDTTAWFASAEQARANAKYAALQALETYIKETSDPEYASEQRHIALGKALAAANAAGLANVVLAAKDNPEQFSSTVLSGSPSNLEHPVLIAGRYYTAQNPLFDSALNNSSDCLQGVCGAGKEPPCFVPLHDVDPSCDPYWSGDPNAFRIVGPYIVGLRKWFAAALSGGEASIYVDEVAAVVPRHTCFLVDLSETMAQETHLYDSNTLAYRSSLAYFLSEDNPGVLKTSHPNDPHDDTKWSHLSPNRSNPPIALQPQSPEFKRKHYRDDYTPIDILVDTDYAQEEDYALHHPDPNSALGAKFKRGNEKRTFQVGTKYFQSPGEFAGTSYESGPEPFTSVFRVLNALVGKFKERSIIGDRICLIFFDDTLDWPRIINLTSDFDYVEKFTDITSPGDERGWKLLFKHGIFPVQERNSNLLMATAEAMNQFASAQESGMSALNQIVFFSDGLSNCTNCTGICGDPVAGAGCRNIYSYYNQSVKELHEYAVTELYPRRVRLDFFLLGSHVLPNNMLIGHQPVSESYECMSDTDARNKKIDFVDGNEDYYNSLDLDQLKLAYSNQSEETPFLRPNIDMYRIVRLLGGSWIPVKKHVQGISCEETCGQIPTRSDQSCKTPTDQVLAAVDEIMGSNPYMIVKH